VVDIFRDPEYVDETNQTDIFAFGADEFNIKDVYEHYYKKQRRYPV